MDKNQILTDWASNHKANGISAAQMIAEYYPQQIGMLIDPDMWPQIVDQAASAFHVDIVTPKQDTWKLNILEQYSDSVRRSVKFPPNTCFLHGLGCLSAAMSRQFTYIPYQGSDEQRPVNLFCVSGQPPSTGKSGVNNAFMLPIRIAYESINKVNATERKKAEGNIQELRKELKNATGAQAEYIEGDLIKAAQKVESLPDYVTDVNDATPEGLEKLISKQGGWGNIISAEAEAINVMLGSVYGDSSKKANNGLFLAMWAGEWVSVQRSGRDGFRGNVKGTCAVLAQPDTVDAILEAGKQGRGISERFLLIKEPHMLGERNHHEYVPVDKSLKADYIDLINNLVNDQGVTFSFDEQAHSAINDYRNHIEAKMADNGLYNDSMIRGTMGKAGEQVQKIASIMWGAQEWSKNGRRRKVIGYKTTCRAIEIFDELSRTYLKAAEDSGCAGLSPKLAIVTKQLKNRFQKDIKDRKIPKITVQQLQQNLKSKKEFASTGGLTGYLREVILPALVDANVVMLCRGEWLINPNVLDGE